MNINFIEELLEPIFSNVHLPVMMTCLIILSILITVGLYHITAHYMNKHVKEQTPSNIEKIYTKPMTIKRYHWSKTEWTFKFIYTLVYFLALTYTTLSCMLFAIAYQHGYREYMKQTVHEIIYSVKHTPIESKLPNDLTNATIIYYRFGCNDCNKIDNQLQEKFKDSPKTYWVATRSKQGKDLREDYPIESVPSAVYITEDKKGIVFDLATKTTINEKVSTSVNEDNVNTILHMQTAHNDSN